MDDVLSRHRFSAREWQEMGRLGLFRNDARLELVDGEILEMSPIGIRHALCVGLLTQLLVNGPPCASIHTPVHASWLNQTGDLLLRGAAQGGEPQRLLRSGRHHRTTGQL